MRRPAKSKRPGKAEITNSKTLVAPVKGWNARDPISAMPEGYAIYMDNMWATPTAVETRKGATDHVTGFANPVLSLMAWNGRTTTAGKKLFAATDAGIYDATTAGVVGAAVSTLTNGRCQHVNFSTTGASYLVVVNGVDVLRHYNGTIWTNVASFSIDGGGTLSTTEISNLNVFKRSLYFLRKDTLDFYYLPIDSIAGNVKSFPLGGLFNKGGYIVAMGNWSIDGGQGVDDYAAFVTSEGQIAIYRGTDPSSSSTWALQGIYDLGTPLGKKCFRKYGGDVLYLSASGLYPLGKYLQSATLNATLPITDIISSAFNLAAQSYRNNFGWEVALSELDNLLLVNIPTTEGSISHQYVMNTKSNRWARFTDWNAFCFEVSNNRLYMGMSDKVALCWNSAADFDSNINCYVKAAFSYLGVRAREKHIKLARPNLVINGNISASLAIDIDYATGTSYGPSVFNPATGSLWDEALWDTGVWQDVSAPLLNWVTVAVPAGYCAATRLRVIAKDATVLWSAIDLLYEMGAAKG